MEKTVHARCMVRRLLPGWAALMVVASPMAHAGDICLPSPAREGTVSMDEALNSRRTHRSFQGRALTLKQFSPMLWAAYGVTAVSAGRPPEDGSLSRRIVSD
jgi:hypothetical protein